jgi:hypothetical protein
MGLGGMLDGLACGVGDHIWVQDTDVEGVMARSRCGAEGDVPPVSDVAADGSESIVPRNRPWLEGPFTSDEL